MRVRTEAVLTYRTVMTRILWKTLASGLLAFSIIVPSCGRERKPAEKPSARVASISIYYMGWNIETFSSQSCSDLVPTSAHIEIRDSNRKREFVAAIRSAELVEEVGYDGIDTRICCVLQDSSGSIVTKVSFSYTSLMQVDAKVYKTDQKLFLLVLGYLPKDYLKT
jgi:hypothetical protein